MNYRGNLEGFGGKLDEPGTNYFALVDVERLCGQSDYTGLDVKGGVSLYAFFKGLLNDGAHGVTAAYLHVNYMQHYILSSAGVQVEE